MALSLSLSKGKCSILKDIIIIRLVLDKKNDSLLPAKQASYLPKTENILSTRKLIVPLANAT